MKLKATISLPGDTFNLSEIYSLARLVNETNNTSLHNYVGERVLTRHLHAVNFGPAEFFVQVSDRSTRAREGSPIGIDIALSRVSVTHRRATQDYWEALKELNIIYLQVIESNLVRSLEAQVFISMALDKQTEYTDGRPGSTSLPEIGPTLVKGLAVAKDISEAKVIREELAALLGDRRTMEGFLKLAAELPQVSRERES